MADNFNVEMRDVISSLDNITAALMDIASSNGSAGGSSSSKSGGRSSKNDKLMGTVTKLLGGKGGLGSSLASLAGGALKAVGPVGLIVTTLIKCTKAAGDYNAEMGKTLSALNGATTAANSFSKTSNRLKENLKELEAALGNTGLGKAIDWITDKLADAAKGWSYLFNGFQFYSDNPDREEIWATNTSWQTNVGKSEAMNAYDRMLLSQNQSGLGYERSSDVTEALLDKAVEISETTGVAFKDLASGIQSIAGSGTGQTEQGLMITQDELNYLAYTTYGVFAESLTPMAKQELVNNELMRQLVILQEQGVSALMDYNANFVKQAKVVDTIKQGLFSFDEVIGLDAKNVGGEGKQDVKDNRIELNADEIAEEMKTGILDKIKNWIDENMPHLGQLMDNVGENWRTLKEEVGNNWTTMVDSIKTRWERLKEGKISIWDFITGTTKDIWDFIVETTKDVWTFIKETSKDVWDFIKESSKSIWTWIKGKSKSVWTWIKGKAKPVWDWITGKAKSIWTWITGAAKSVWTWITGAAKSVWNWITGAAKSIWTWISESSKTVWTWIKGTAKTVWTWIKGKTKPIWDWIKDTSKDIWDWVTNKSKEIWSYVSGTTKAIWDYVSNTFKSIWDYVSSTTKSIWDFITTPARNAWDYFFGEEEDGGGHGGGHEFATGGVVTSKINATVGEAGREAIIPLEDNIGINYLASAMREAGGTGNETVVNVTLNGQLLEMNDYNVRKLGEKLGAVIDNERNRRGGVNYDQNN